MHIDDNDSRLDWLLERFLEESSFSPQTAPPDDKQGKRDLLRALMNIRQPAPADDEVLAVQDEYLQARALEKGIVSLGDIPSLAELGSTHRHAETISLWQGDITRISCDAIVNAANSQMLGCFKPLHACIDNVIHTYSGIQLRLECNRQMNELRQLHGDAYEQPTSIPLVTGAFNLPCRAVIHVVGPIVQGDLADAHVEQLAACYENSLDCCLAEGLRSIAFCCISTGVFRFPKERAATIAIESVSNWLDEHAGTMDRVIFNVFKDEDRTYYERELL